MNKFLIVKRGLYYRPNSRGYTGLKDEAGRYTLEEVAERFPNLDTSQQDGMEFINEDDAPEYSFACASDIKMQHRIKKIEEKEDEMNRLRDLVVELEAERDKNGRLCIGEALGHDRALRRAEAAEAKVKTLVESLNALLNYDNLGAYERSEVRQKARTAIQEDKT